MPVGQEGEHPAAFSRGVVEDDGSRVGDAARCRSNHTFGQFDLGGCQVVVDLPVKAAGQPRGGHSFWSYECALAAGGELGGDGGGKSSGRGFNNFGVVFAQALDHELDAGFGGKSAPAEIGAGQSRIGIRALTGIGGNGLGRVADAVEDNPAGLAGGCGRSAHLASLIDNGLVCAARAAHHSWKFWLGRPRRSRVWVHLPPTLGRE